VPLLSTIVRVPVVWTVRLPFTVARLVPWGQVPPSDATLMVRLPQLTLGNATGFAPPFDHFWISTVLLAPKVREVEPGMSVATPFMVPLTTAWT
jgi:hypothetical protein